LASPNNVSPQNSCSDENSVFGDLALDAIQDATGQVDKKTQRVAWKIGSNNTVIETGLQNLTQDVASCLLHFGPDTTQTWLLVRLKQPEMPNAPQSTSEPPKES
jgi:hypothetical protein